MVISIISILGFAMTAIPCIYFLNNYLKPKYNAIRTWGYGLVIIESFVISAALFFFQLMILKMLAFLISFYVCAIFLYEGTIIRKITAPFLLIAIMLLTELPFDYVLVYILHFDLMSMLQSAPLLLLLRLIYNGIVWLNYYLLLTIINRNSILYREPQLYFLMCVQLFMEAYSISMLQVSGVYKASLHTQISIMGMLALGIIGTSGLMLLYLRRLYQRTKLELSMKKMEIEYSKLLTEYLNMNDELYLYLRHDIMNSLIHNEIREKGESYEATL